uniref:Transmembrane 4 L six family member 21a n=1 Tax=Oryzias sinensis TaxID=183150 RepID=A0A8C8A3H6_9TELE
MPTLKRLRTVKKAVLSMIFLKKTLYIQKICSEHLLLLFQVLLPALYIHLTGTQGCCGNRCGMFLSIAFAAVGVAGGLYSFIVAVLGLKNGPYCKVLLAWTTPFKDSEEGYLSDSSKWIICTEPSDIVQFHIGLFSTLLATSSLQVILCAAQMINGLFGCLCGTCGKKDVI